MWQAWYLNGEGDALPRPFGPAPDIGADELQVAAQVNAIAGRITEEAGGAAVDGVMVTFFGPAPGWGQTTSSGDYVLTDLVSGATYVVAPFKSGYTFSPAWAFITVGAGAQADFVASRTSPY